MTSQQRATATGLDEDGSESETSFDMQEQGRDLTAEEIEEWAQIESPTSKSPLYSTDGVQTISEESSSPSNQPPKGLHDDATSPQSIEHQEAAEERAPAPVIARQPSQVQGVSSVPGFLPEPQVSQPAQGPPSETARTAPHIEATQPNEPVKPPSNSETRGPVNEIQPGTPRSTLDSPEYQALHGRDGDGGSTSQSRGTGAQGSWGWGGGWNLNAIGGRLAQVAAGAVRDVKELKESFQQVINEVALAPEEEDERDLEPQAAINPHQPPAAVDIDRSDEQASTVPDDDELEIGLKAIDDQVGHLASGAAKALTSLFGGLSAATRRLASKAEGAPLEGGSEADHYPDAPMSPSATPQRGASEKARGGWRAAAYRLATTAEKGLETVGRTALDLLQEVVGPPPGWDGSSPGETGSFMDFLDMYGGLQVCEELEALSNDCARLCNRSRTQLDAEQQARLDLLADELSTLFLRELNLSPVPSGASTSTSTRQGGASLAGEGPSGSAVAGPSAELDGASLADGAPSGSAGASTELDGASLAVLGQLAASYEPVAYLVRDCKARAQRYLDEAGAVENQRQERQQQQQEKESLADGSASGAEEPLLDATSAEEDEVSVADVAFALRTAALKRIAEVCTAQVQLLVNYGFSIAARARQGLPTESDVAWPQGAVATSTVLRRQVVRMADDTSTAAAVFCAALSDLSSLLPEADRKLVVEVAGDGVRAVQLAEAEALARLQSGFQSLLFAVLIRALLDDIA